MNEGQRREERTKGKTVTSQEVNQRGSQVSDPQRSQHNNCEFFIHQETSGGKYLKSKKTEKKKYRKVLFPL